MAIPECSIMSEPCKGLTNMEKKGERDGENMGQKEEKLQMRKKDGSIIF